MDQGGRLQGLAGGQVGHAGAGQLVQLLVHDGHQALRRRDVAGLSCLQQFRDGLDRLGGHGLGIRKKSWCRLLAIVG